MLHRSMDSRAASFGLVTSFDAQARDATIHDTPGLRCFRQQSCLWQSTTH